MIDLSLAVHESGHALVAVALGVRIHSVSADDGAGGRCVLAASVQDQLAAGTSDPMVKAQAAVVDLAITLAGPAAESLLIGGGMDWERDGCDLDVAERAELLVAELCGVPAYAPAWRGMVWAPTVAFLNREWDALSRITVELKRAGELDGARVVSLAGSISRPDLQGAVAYARFLQSRHGSRPNRPIATVST